MYESETVTVGRTEVEVRETEDGFVARQVGVDLSDLRQSAEATFSSYSHDPLVLSTEGYGDSAHDAVVCINTSCNSKDGNFFNEQDIQYVGTEWNYDFTDEPSGYDVYFFVSL